MERKDLKTFLGLYFKKWCGEEDAGPEKYPSTLYLLFASIGGFIGVCVMSFSATYASSEYFFVISSHGATVILVFGSPSGPFSQPRNVIGGHIVASLVGLACRELIAIPMGNISIALPVAVTITFLLMQLTKTVNPSAGATVVAAAEFSPSPLVAAGWGLFVPAIVYACVIVFLGCVFINLVPGESYPKYWFVQKKSLKHYCKCCYCCVAEKPSRNQESISQENGEVQEIDHRGRQGTHEIWSFPSTQHTKDKQNVDRV